MRNVLSHAAALAAKLDKLEHEVPSRLDSHETAIVELMQQFRSIINPDDERTTSDEGSAKREIGFHVRDRGEGKALN